MALAAAGCCSRRGGPTAPGAPRGRNCRCRRALPAALRALVPAVPAPMAAVPPPVYVYSPEYVTLCDSLCKVPKRVSAAAGARGRGERSGEARAGKEKRGKQAARREECGLTAGMARLGAHTAPERGLGRWSHASLSRTALPAVLLPGTPAGPFARHGSGPRGDPGRESRCREESEAHLVCESLGPWLLALCLLLSQSYSFL